MTHVCRVHGASGTFGVPMHDFSSNINVSGPCPQVQILRRCGIKLRDASSFALALPMNRSAGARQTRALT